MTDTVARLRSLIERASKEAPALGHVPASYYALVDITFQHGPALLAVVEAAHRVLHCPKDQLVAAYDNLRAAFSALDAKENEK